MHISPQKYTEARKEGNRKWDTANLDRVSVAMPKGKKDIIKAHAEAHSESVNGFINRAIDEAIERDESARRGIIEERRAIPPLLLRIL